MQCDTRHRQQLRPMAVHGADRRGHVSRFDHVVSRQRTQPGRAVHRVRRGRAGDRPVRPDALAQHLSRIRSGSKESGGPISMRRTPSPARRWRCGCRTITAAAVCWATRCGSSRRRRPKSRVLDGGAELTSGSSTVDLGSTVPGTPLLRTFTVRNDGGAELVLGTITLPDGYSLVAPFPASTLAPRRVDDVYGPVGCDGAGDVSRARSRWAITTTTKPRLPSTSSAR